MPVDILTFLKNHLHNICELTCLLIAIFYYNYLRKSFMKWILPFIAFIFIMELVNIYLLFHNPRGVVISINYIIGIIESLFYGYVFYQLSDVSLFRKGIFAVLLISVLVYSFGFILHVKDYQYYLFGLIVSGFSLSLIALIYIYILFLSEDHRVSILLNPGFWLAFGVSLFFSGISVVFYLRDYIAEYNLNIFGVKLYNFVPRILCIVLYSSISVAIILCKKTSRLSLTYKE